MKLSPETEQLIQDCTKDDESYQKLIEHFSSLVEPIPLKAQDPLFEQTNDAVFILDFEGQHINVNQRASDMFGYTVDELMLMAYRDLVTEEAHASSGGMLERLKRGEVIPPYERVFKHKDGHLIYAELNVQGIFQDGEPVYIQSIIRDITDRKEMEITTHSFLEDMTALQSIHLELSEIESLDVLQQRMIELANQRLGFERIALFRLNVDGTHLHGTYGIDTDGKLRDESYYQEPITDNHWTYQILNAPFHAYLIKDGNLQDNRQFIGHGWKSGSALWSGSRSLGYLVCDNYISGKPPRPYEMELISLLGTTFGHLISRKEAELALRKSELLYRSLVKNMTEGVVLHRNDGSIQMSNPAASEILGLTQDQLAGRTSLDPRWRTIHEDGSPFPGDTHPAMITLQTGKTQRDVIMGVYKPDDELSWISVTSLPIHNVDSHQPYGILATFTDITELRKSQEEKFEMALEQEKFQLLQNFIEKSSHEFRTPLASISMNAYLISQMTDLEKLDKRVSAIDRQVTRITKLVDMLLLMATLEGGKTLPYETIHIGMLLENLCSSFQAQYTDQPSLEITIPDDFPSIDGNMHYLRQAFDQLLDNAYRFTLADGNITITGESNETHVILYIKDTGIGIAEEHLPEIFNIFWRLDEAHTSPGLGLGLSITDKIVEMHRGGIQVTNTLNNGTCLSITLPRVHTE